MRIKDELGPGWPQEFSFSPAVWNIGAMGSPHCDHGASRYSDSSILQHLPMSQEGMEGSQGREDAN